MSHLDKKNWKMSKKKVLRRQFAPAWQCTWCHVMCMHAAFYPVFCDSIAVRLTKRRISQVPCYLLLYMVIVILFPVWGLSKHVV